jgi:tetratricopeptide (TPR) repeat protein
MLGAGVTAAACLAAATAFVVTPAAFAQDSGNTAARYLQIVDRYAAGQRAEALAALSGWSQRELGRGLEALRASSLHPCSPCLEPVQVKAAVMLHTDRDDVERRLLPPGDEGEPVCGDGAHAEYARKAAVLLFERPDGRDFGRRWLLAMALRDQHAFCLPNALRWADEGVRWFAKDPELLLVRGTLQEVLATLVDSLPGLADTNPRTRQQARSKLNERRYWLTEARRSLEAALVADPSLHEARLRLGRVAWRLDQKDAAQHALEAMLSATTETTLAYLGHLYLGRVHESSGRLDTAESEYRKAVALDPTGQSAAVALSYVLGLTGEPAESRAVLEAAVARGGSRKVADPFWSYSSGRSDEGEPMLDQLRRETER